MVKPNLLNYGQHTSHINVSLKSVTDTINSQQAALSTTPKTARSDTSDIKEKLVSTKAVAIEGDNRQQDNSVDTEALTNLHTKSSLPFQKTKPIHKNSSAEQALNHQLTKDNPEKVIKSELTANESKPAEIGALDSSAFDVVDSKVTSTESAHQQNSSSFVKDEEQLARYKIGSNSNPYPDYPSLAAKRGWQGEVVLGVYVKPDGSIEHLTFVKSTDYGVLNYEAYETVRTSWHFEPIEDDGEPEQSMYIEVPIVFSLANR